MRKQLYTRKHHDVGTWVLIVVCWIVVWGAYVIVTAGR